MVATRAKKKTAFALRYSVKRIRHGRNASTFSARPCHRNKRRRRKGNMSKKNNRINVPEAREAMDKFKMEAASEVAVSAPS